MANLRWLERTQRGWRRRFRSRWGGKTFAPEIAGRNQRGRISTEASIPLSLVRRNKWHHLHFPYFIHCTMKYGLTFPFCLTMLVGLAAAASVCPSLGDGYPGRIEPYTTSPSLQQHRDGFLSQPDGSDATIRRRTSISIPFSVPSPGIKGQSLLIQ